LARIFLSYARDDADAAKQLAACISERGHEVWWDRHLHAGSRFAAEIDKAFLNYPELRPFFYDGVMPNEKIDAVQARRAASLADIHLDVFELLFVEMIIERVPDLKLGKDRLHWDNYMRRTFETSPLMCARLAALANEYETGLVSFAAKPCLEAHKIRLQP